MNKFKSDRLKIYVQLTLVINNEYFYFFKAKCNQLEHDHQNGTNTMALNCITCIILTSQCRSLFLRPAPQTLTKIKNKKRMMMQVAWIQKNVGAFKVKLNFCDLKTWHNLVPF